jgi:hypothetical protein
LICLIQHQIINTKTNTDVTYYWHLEIPIDEVVDLEVLVIVTPGVEQRLCNLDPTKVTDELDDGVVGDVDGRRVEEERVPAVRQGDVDAGSKVGHNQGKVRIYSNIHGEI